jgi:hypothetical protein
MLVERRYADIPFPFDEISMPEFSMTARWNLADLVGYLGTWSSVERYRQQQGADPLALIKADLSAAWGPAESERPVTWPLFFRVGRVG